MNEDRPARKRRFRIPKRRPRRGGEENTKLRARFDRKISLSKAIIACVLCALVAGLFGMLITRWRIGGSDVYRMARKLAEVKEVVDDNYIGEIDDDAITNAAAAAIVAGTGDRWSYYLTAEQYEAYQMYSNNEYTGIGVTLQAGGGTAGLQIVAVASQSPAEKAGLKAGESIIEVDGQPVADRTLAEVQAQIREKVNQTLTLTVRSASGESRTVKVDCTVIHTEPVTYEMLEDNIGYVKIANFESGAGAGAIKAVKALLDSGAKSLIFDVRGNPGGKVNELVTILDYLLPEGDLFVSVDRSGKETVTTSDNIALKIPMVVLIDASSYSAAEYFAAALQEYQQGNTGWATIVGEATTGKGRSQTTIVLSDGSAVHISSARYLTPNRVDLSEVGGVTPDVKVLPGAEDSELDLQLEEAKKILK